MDRRIIYLIIFLLFCTPLHAGVIMMGGAGTSEAPSGDCGTSNDTVVWDFLGTGTSGAATNAFACNEWILAGNTTITEYKARYRYTSGTGSVKICLLPDDGEADSMPDGTTCIVGTDSSLTQASMTAGSFLDYTHTLATPVEILVAANPVVWVCNIAVGTIERDFHYYSSALKEACYGNAACSTNDDGYINASIDVYGCE